MLWNLNRDMVSSSVSSFLYICILFHSSLYSVLVHSIFVFSLHSVCLIFWWMQVSSLCAIGSLVRFHTFNRVSKRESSAHNKNQKHKIAFGAPFITLASCSFIYSVLNGRHSTFYARKVFAFGRFISLSLLLLLSCWCSFILFSSGSLH